MFSNVMDADDAQQLRTYARIIEQQNRRLAELERQHDFLESELEARTSDLARLESTMERREKEWMAENDRLRTERDKFEEAKKAEVSKNERMLELINKKDAEIRRMIQRKVRVGRPMHSWQKICCLVYFYFVSGGPISFRILPSLLPSSVRR